MNVEVWWKNPAVTGTSAVVTLFVFLSITATPSSECSSSILSSSMVPAILLVLAVTAVCNGILPEIVDPGISHILENDSAQGQAEPDSVFVEVEQLPEDPQQKPEDSFHQVSSQLHLSLSFLHDI